jgi:hypothetical protein
MAYVSSNSPPKAPVTITLQVTFKDTNGIAFYDANGPITFTSPTINSASTTEAWTPLQVTNATGGLDLVAPAGAVSATVQLYENNQSYMGGNAYADDLYLTQTQAAAPPSFSIKTSVSGGQLNISFPTVNGLTYDVLYKAKLNDSSAWQTNSTVAGNGNVMSVQDTLGGAGRFYRVRAH